MVEVVEVVEVVKVVKVVGVAEVSLKLRLTQLKGWVDPSSSKTILRINLATVDFIASEPSSRPKDNKD